MLILLTETQYFDLRILRKHNRYAYLRIRPNRRIEVSAPVKMSYTAILELIQQKKQWILENSEAQGEVYGQEEKELLPIGKEEILLAKSEAENAAIDALERVYPLIKPYGAPIPEVHVRYMISKWGSCIPQKKKIWLNIYLVKLPEFCMDYVMLRLLMQLVYPKQDQKFYALLNQLMPQWKQCDDILHKIQLPTKKMIESSPKIY